VRAPHPCVFFAGLLYAATATAQFTGTVAAVSDYRFRGVSLSHEKPAAQLTVTYDAPAGGYAGVFASTVEFAASASKTVQIVGFLGTALPITSGVHADVGINYASFGGALRDYNYGEVYAGVSSGRYSASVHYSPDYFGASDGYLYGAFDVAHAMTDRVALLAHVGMLVPTRHEGAASARRPVDARAGVGFDFAGFNLQIAWVTTNATRASYPVDNRQRGDTFVISVLRAF
jgi:uncharacterized protein (TIGR02001 family)